MNDTTLLAIRAAVEAALRERRELREGGCYDSDDFCDGYERGLERAIRIISQEALAADPRAAVNTDRRAPGLGRADVEQLGGKAGHAGDPGPRERGLDGREREQAQQREDGPGQSGTSSGPV